MGLLGILVALGLLIWLAYRGWSVLLLAPAAAILAAGLPGDPLLAHWTQTFMASAAQFVMQFFPIFLLGALFGKLMEDSGSVSAIATFMTKRLGAQARRASGRARRRCGHLWRGQPLRRFFRARADGACAVSRRSDPETADAGGDCPRHIDLHHVDAAGHAGDSERDPDAVLRHNAVRGTRPWRYRLCDYAGVWALVAFIRRIAARAGRARAMEQTSTSRTRPRIEIVRERATTSGTFDPAEIVHGDQSQQRRQSLWQSCRSL